MFFIASSCGGSVWYFTGVICAACFQKNKLDCNLNRKIIMKEKICGSQLPATGTHGEIRGISVQGMAETWSFI